MNEETKVFNDGSNEKKMQNETQKATKENKLQGMKTVAAVAGGVVVGNLAWGLAGEAKEAVDEYIAESQTEEPEEIEVTEEVEATEVVQTEHLPDGGIEAADVSNIVTENMSFNEAFAAARADVGSGGVFEWKGNLYGTYYKEEWDNLSPEETQEYWASVEAADVDIEQEVLPEDVQPEELIAKAEIIDIDGDGDKDSIVVDTNNDGEIDVVGTDLDGDGNIDVVASDLDGDGKIDTVVADTNYDGQVDAIVADTNYDGKIDTIAADTNYDGKIDEFAQDTDSDGEVDMHETTEDNGIIADSSEMEDDFDDDADMHELA